MHTGGVRISNAHWKCVWITNRHRESVTDRASWMILRMFYEYRLRIDIRIDTGPVFGKVMLLRLVSGLEINAGKI